MIQRVALLTDGVFPWVMGGIQKHSFHLARYLARRGVRVDLYHCPERPGQTVPVLDGFAADERTLVRAIAVDFPAPGAYPGHYLRELFLYSRRLRAALARQSPADLVYAQGFTGWQFVRERRAGIPGAPVAVNLHGLNMFQTDRRARARLEACLFRPAARYLLRHADVVVSLPGRLQELTRRLGVPEARLAVFPLGVEGHWVTGQIRPPHDPRRLLFIGRDDPVKGVRHLGSALRALLPRHAMSVTVVGPLRSLGGLSHPAVRHVGEIRDETALQALVRECDVLVCPSLSEGMPYAILEAMASGLAVIATDVGAVDRLVDPTTGWLIPPGDARALESAIEQSLALPAEDLARLKAAARARVRSHFLWEDLIDEILATLTARVSGHGAGSP